MPIMRGARLGSIDCGATRKKWAETIALVEKWASAVSYNAEWLGDPNIEVADEMKEWAENERRRVES